MSDDPREAAARYRLARDHPEFVSDGDETDAAATRPTPATSAAEQAAVVEMAIQQAIRRGEFDDLPGAGKPLEGLGTAHDPDWWIRRKIQAEQLRGLGPPALTLRVEDAEMHGRLDALHTESDVRDTVEDFNRRVIEARRQLLGGPPVVTRTREVEDEVRAWIERRERRPETNPMPPKEPRRRRWRLR